MSIFHFFCNLQSLSLDNFAMIALQLHLNNLMFVIFDLHVIIYKSQTIYMNISVAHSDTINHTIILNRLENYVGISGFALAWFESYLSDCHQFVAVNEEVSYQSQVQYGIPQVSVLGPLQK